MSILELMERVKHALTGADEERPERRVMRVQDLSQEDVLALAAANTDHLDARPRRLPR